MFDDLELRVARYRRFYESEDPALLVHLRCLDHGGSEGRRRHPTQLSSYDFKSSRDRRRHIEDLCLEVPIENELHPLPDDFLPAAKIVGWIFILTIADLELKPMGHGDHMEPCLTDLGQVSGLGFELDESNFWWEVYREAQTELYRAFGDTGFVTPVYHPGPLDIAWALRGPSLYTDFYEDPEGVERLVGFCSDSILKIADAVRDIGADMGAGRYCVPGWGFNVLVPGRGGITTADVSCQLSPEMFGRVELGRIRCIAGHAPGYLLHTHSVGVQHQKAYADIEGVEILQIVSDPNMPNPADDIASIFQRVGSMPLLITATAESVRRNIAQLRGGRAVLRVDVENKTEGRELLALVRDNSRIQ